MQSGANSNRSQLLSKGHLCLSNICQVSPFPLSSFQKRFHFVFIFCLQWASIPFIPNYLRVHHLYHFHFHIFNMFSHLADSGSIPAIGDHPRVDHFLQHAGVSGVLSTLNLGSSQNEWMCRLI